MHFAGPKLQDATLPPLLHSLCHDAANAVRAQDMAGVKGRGVVHVAGDLAIEFVDRNAKYITKARRETCKDPCIPLLPSSARSPARTVPAPAPPAQPTTALSFLPAASAPPLRATPRRIAKEASRCGRGPPLSRRGLCSLFSC